MTACALALGICVSVLTAAAARADAIDDLIHREMARRHIPGLAIVVVRDGAIAIERYYGLADVERKRPVTGSTSFEIASMSKAFTAAGVLLLSEAGKIGLEDSVSRYLGDLPERWRGITIRQLMNHTSGLRDDWDEPDSFFLAHTSNESFLEALESTPLRFEPGHGFHYSCGPFVLGMIIEKVTGLSYAEFMRARIFMPLGMTATRVNDPRAVPPGLAVGYRYDRDSLTYGSRISPCAEARADVGIATTGRDLAKWDAALSKPGFLKAESLREMFSASRLADGACVPYGLGWFVIPYRGHDVLTHGGALRTGFSSVIERYRDEHMTIVILTNLRNAHPFTLSRAVAATFAPDYRPMDTMTPHADPGPKRTEQVAALLRRLSAGAVDPRELVARYHEVYDDAEELRESLAELRSIAYLDRIVPKAHRPSVLGPSIAEIDFYRASARIESYWSVAFAADGTIVYLEREL